MSKEVLARSVVCVHMVRECVCVVSVVPIHVYVCLHVTFKHVHAKD